MDPHISYNILVIDEEVEYASLIEQILEELSPNMSNIFWFENEAVIWDFFNLKTPPTISIILLDIENSKFDGIALLKQFKDEASPFKIIPIIIFSRLQEFAVINQCFSLGANSWVHKPTDLKNIRSILEIICEFWLKHSILPSSLI